MKFALLGSGPTAVLLARAIGGSPRHVLSHAVHAAADADELLRACPGVQIGDDPSPLFTEADLDAVVVSGHEPRVRDVARQLAGQGQSLVVVPRAAQETTFAYELSLARDEHDLRMVPLSAGTCHPGWTRLADRLADAPGSAAVAQWERVVPPSQAPDGLLDPPFVDELLLEDVIRLRMLFGDFERVTAIRAGTTGERFARQTVTLAGDRTADVTWSVAVAEHPWTWRMTSGPLTAWGTGDPAELHVEAMDGDVPGEFPTRVDLGPVLLEHVVAALEGGNVRPGWNDLVRDFEIVDASRRSLRRRRTIDLQFETTSERNQFKSQMAAGGCSVLMLTLFAMVATMLVDAIVEVPPAWIPWVRVLVFAPVFAFLVLQVLIVLARPSAAEREPNDAQRGE